MSGVEFAPLHVYPTDEEGHTLDGRPCFCGARTLVEYYSVAGKAYPYRVIIHRGRAERAADQS